MHNERLIDANALEVVVAQYIASNAYLNDSALDILRKVMTLVEEAPPVDAVTVVHGQWLPVWKHLFKLKHFKCSVCGHREKEGGWAYCHCGAKMDGGFC